jgi:Zn-dependent M28 family amino/carboxypeptidase
MEAMRILEAAVPNPRRTIIGALWNGEEQGLNGSRAFVEDHPEILERTHAVFNLDHGTGPVTLIPLQGFTAAGSYFGNWLAQVPSEYADLVTLEIPGRPESGGTDHASFVCAGVPAFSFNVGAGRSDDLPMGTNRWDTSIYTWHTNRDSFDKIIFEDLRDDAVMTAMLAYLASEDPEILPRDRRVMADGAEWPECRSPARSSMESNR